MAVKTENEISPNARGLWLKAHSAAELRNYSYAISLLQDLLKEEPEFLNARKLLRRSAIANTAGKKPAASMFGSKAGGMVKKDPQGAMVEAEKALSTKPYDVSAGQALKEAAVALNMVETAQFALEIVVEGNPKDIKLMHHLGNFYEENGMPEKAAEVFYKIAELAPADLTAGKKAKDNSARASMSQNYEGKTDYRDSLRSKEDSLAREDDARAVMSPEQLQRQMKETFANYEADPTNMTYVRRLAQLCERSEDWETALQWQTYAYQLSNNSDPGIKRKMDDLAIKLLEQRIDQYKAALEEPSLDEDTRTQYQATLDELNRQRMESRLESARARVLSNPTDLSLRLELGDILFQTGNYDEAIGHLQKARNSPSGKIRAMMLLGRCYESKGMYDFAISQLEAARDSLSQMDSTKKEVVYSLALVLEKLGKNEDYLANMKKIYEADYGYRDVAKRVEAAY